MLDIISNVMQGVTIICLIVTGYYVTKSLTIPAEYRKDKTK